MRIALNLLFGMLVTLPLGIWMLIVLYYGWLRNEATIVGLNLKVVLGAAAGFGLSGLLVTNIAFFFGGEQHKDSESRSGNSW